MMKQLFTVLAAAVMVFYSGCELVTDEPPKVQRVIGDEMIINEVYAVAPSRYYAYSWIELYNQKPTPTTWLTDHYPASAYAIGGGGSCIRTTNDGRDWTSLTVGSAANFEALDIPYRDSIMVVGEAGAIGKIVIDAAGNFTYFDQSLNLQPGVQPVSLHDVQFLAQSRTGYAAGDRGRIFRTTNLGARWDTLRSNTTQNQNDFLLVDLARFYSCGDSGTVLKRATGTSLTPLTNIPQSVRQYNFYSMFFVSDTGWVVGQGGTIIHTTNAGGVWNVDTMVPGVTFRSGFTAAAGSRGLDQRGVRYPDYKNGWAWVCGDNGEIWRTKNKGVRWERLLSGTSANLYRIEFFDSATGWAFGEGGVVLRTTNAGASWQVQTSNVAGSLRSSRILSPTVAETEWYVIQMVAKRKEFFFDPLTGTINFDFFVKIDTGFLYFDPLILFQNGVAGLPKPIPAGGFAIINSDSNRFKDHMDLGPGQTVVINASIGYYFDTTSILGVRPVLWDLLSSGEIRLVKFAVTQVVSTNPPSFLAFNQRTIDVVRYGGYMPSTADFPPDQIYPGNIPHSCWFTENPTGGCVIPDGWSLARYANDQSTDPDRQNTSKSFYMTPNPIPGWYSQEKRVLE